MRCLQLLEQSDKRSKEGWVKATGIILKLQKMITRKDQYDWAVKRVEELLSDKPLDTPKLIELELLTDWVAGYEEKAEHFVEDNSSKFHMEDIQISDRLQSICGSIRIHSLNEDIPEMVTQEEIKKAADQYEQIDIQWKNSCKWRDLGAKEEAGDELYRLVRGLLKRGAF